MRGDRASGANAWLKLGRADVALGDYARARPCLEHAQDLFRRTNDTLGVAAATNALARVVWLGGGEGGYDEAAADQAWDRMRTFLLAELPPTAD